MQTAIPASANAAPVVEAEFPPLPPAAPVGSGVPFRDSVPALSEHEIELNGQLARRIAWKALACGLIADGFTWEQGIGLNLAVYLTLILSAAASVLRLRMGSVPKGSVRLLWLGGVFSLLLVVRDAEELRFFNVIACLSCLILAIAVARASSPLSVFSARVRDVIVTAMRAASDVLTGSIPLLYQLGTRTHGAKRTALLRALRVISISAGLTFAFGALLSSGDPVFRSATQWMLNWDAGSLGPHLLTIALLTWPAAGLLWGSSAMTRTSLIPATSVFPPLSLRSTDIVGALTTLNILFGVFVATQARVLFGGQDYVLATTGLSLAEYARSGFFTLIVVAGLILSMLLAFNALLDKPGLSASKLMKRLSFSLLALTGVVLVSAASRMVVYMNAFGASPDRVLAMAVIVGLALVMSWFAFTVLRDRPTHFAFGTLAIGWSTLIMFNAVNPHALIARNHLNRAARGELFDAELIARHLGLDVIPAVVAAAEREMQIVQATPLSASAPAPQTLAGERSTTNSRTHACAALAPLATRLKTTNANARWSMWNLAHWRAEQALEGSSERLRVCQ